MSYDQSKTNEKGVESPVRTLMDIDQAAAHLTVTPRFVRTLVADRRVPFLKVGKFIRFDLEDLDAWLDSCRVDAA